MSQLIDTTQMYLRTIVELQEEGVPAMRARLAERLEHSGPTVSQTVSRMQRDGLLTLGDDRRLELTDAGRCEATAVLRKHRIVECLLVTTLGMKLSHAHDEACRWEHVVSEEVERKILALLDFPATSPYGCPIPGLAALGMAGGEAAQGATTSKAGDGAPVAAAPSNGHGEGGQVLRRILTCLPEQEPVSLRVTRLDEAVQDQATCRQLEGVGLLPGSFIHIRRQGEHVELRSDAPPNTRFSMVSEPWTHHIWVQPQPS